jgi:hypothetical protein
MTRLVKIADCDGRVRVNVVFVHGLGGHAYDTWRRNGDDGTLWPAWLARDIPGLAAWTLAYDAPPVNWFGTGMALQDRARNVLECLLGQPALRGQPLVFVGHSLGGLVVKQVLRTGEPHQGETEIREGSRRGGAKSRGDRRRQQCRRRIEMVSGSDSPRPGQYGQLARPG